IASVQWYGIQTSKRRLLILGTDGSCPRDTIYGPTIDTVKRQGGIDVAVTPDNKTVYTTSVGFDVYMQTEDKRSRNVVYKSPLNTTAQASIFLGKLDQPGAGDGEFNKPEGIAVDNNGNVYVADYGNNRISIYDSNGIKIKHVSSWRPKFIQVNRKNGEFFVLGYMTDTANPVVLTKYSSLPTTDSITSKQFTRLAPTSVIPVMALDYFAAKPIIWIGPLDYWESTIYGFIDEGSTLATHNITIAKKQADAWAGAKIYGPGYLTVSPDESFLYSGCNGWSRVDLKSGAVTSTAIKGNELIFAQDTTLYAYSKDGYKDTVALRYDRFGNRINFKNGSSQLIVGPSEFYSGIGSKGLAMLPNGNLIIPNSGFNRSDTIRYNVWDMNTCTKVDSLPIEMPHAAAGFTADRHGNLYFACNVKPRGVGYPQGLTGEFVPDPELVSYIRYPYAHINYYMFGIGCILKFPQTAKGIHEHIAGKISAVPMGNLNGDVVSEDQVNGIYTSHYKIEGAQWQHLGISHCPSPWRNRGDPGCFCFTPRFSVDGHGRIIYPESYRFNVVIIDNNRNELLRFGEYGNRDQQGKFGTVQSPDIPLTAPWYVEKVKNSIYISDVVSRRILRVKLRYQTSATLNGVVTAEKGSLPVAAAVKAYPLPFNPAVNLDLSLPVSKMVAVMIVDAKGQIVKTYKPQMHNAGIVKYVWDGMDQSGRKVGAGLYFARVKIGSEQFQKSLLFVK
ncbi:MAG: SMP-30/gluconolactonase/LRE family protein, partial [Fibrobacteres bacterium]|nr:SMP-30/gluconolactonase/LRE family protein [Fibrobacterota bacterium]